MTLAELARQAVAVQDACNLRAVTRGYVRALDALVDLGFTGERLATHPIAQVWADKVAHLTGTQEIGTARVMRAHSAVTQLAAVAS